MISVAHIDQLAGALVLDSWLRKAFLKDRLGSIEDYNANYARRYGEKPIELSEEERQLVLSLPADTIEHFHEMLELALDSHAKSPRQLTVSSASYIDANELSRRISSAA